MTDTSETLTDPSLTSLSPSYPTPHYLVLEELEVMISRG